MPAPPDPAKPDPPSPRPLPPRPMPPRPALPRRDYAAEEEAGRRLANAQIQLRRGLIAEAEAGARALLAERPDDAGVYELLGDIQAARGDFEAACVSYQATLAKEPGRVSAEAKFGKATLRRAEQQRREKMGVAYAAEDASLVGRGEAGAEKRGIGWEVFGSVLCPGLGQIVGGQLVKGGILVGIFVLGLGLFAGLAHGAPAHAKASYFGPGYWLAGGLLAADWLYAVVDAALASSRAEPNAAEKDGWQI